MAEEITRGTEESSGSPKPSSTSHFTLQHGLSAEYVHGVEWRVPVSIPRRAFREQESPGFGVQGCTYRLLLEYEVRIIRLMLFRDVRNSGRLVPSIRVTAELTGEEQVLHGSLSGKRLVFIFFPRKIQCPQESAVLHFVVRFQYESSSHDSNRFSQYSTKGEPSSASDTFVSRNSTQRTSHLGYQDTHRMSDHKNSHCLEILSTDLFKLYTDSSHHDVKLLCEGQTVSAHKIILSARSKVLKKRLESEDYQNGCLEVKDISFPVLQQLLGYIYTGSIPDMTEESAAELSVAAGTYSVGILQQRCNNFLKNPLSSQNDCNSLQSLSVDLHELNKDKSGHDVKLQCGDEFASAHSTILSARSNVFKALLKSLDGQSDCVQVEGMDIEVLHQLLRYIYTGILPEMTKELAGELLKAADRYEISALRVRCSNYLKSLIDAISACDMLLFADGLGDKDFKSYVISFIIQECIPHNDCIWKPFCDAQPKLANVVLNHYVKFYK